MAIQSQSMPENDERVKYWRDQVDLLLKSGAALIILFAGWAIDHQDKFNLGIFGKTCDLDHQLAACGLLLMSGVYARFLVVSVDKVYELHLDRSGENTILPKAAARLFSRGLALGVVLIAVLMSVR